MATAQELGERAPQLRTGFDQSLQKRRRSTQALEESPVQDLGGHDALSQYSTRKRDRHAALSLLEVKHDFCPTHQAKLITGHSFHGVRICLDAFNLGAQLFDLFAQSRNL
jgi:hypothetical protein